MIIKKYYLLAVFIFLALAQLCVPLYTVWKWEDVLRNGLPFYWVTKPVDPYDAFRGRYIDLYFQEDKGPLAADSSIDSIRGGHSVYAVLGTDSKGLAVVQEVSVNKPLNKQYVKAKFLRIDKNSLVHIALPFKRYYLPEDLAMRAETEMARKSRNKEYAVAVIRVKDGNGAIENIYFGDESLLKYLRKDGL